MLRALARERSVLALKDSEALVWVTKLAKNCPVLMQVPKSGLMGFGNCAHKEDKHLRVEFLWHRRPYVAILADQVHSPPYDSVASKVLNGGAIYTTWI